MAAEFMQNLCPVGVGPSVNRWPRCELQSAQITSVLDIPWLKSGTKLTLLGIASSKLGQPLPESNLLSEIKIGLPQAPHTKIPSSSVCRREPLKGFSVPFSLKMRYCSGVNSSRHSWSVLSFRLCPFLCCQKWSIYFFLVSPSISDDILPPDKMSVRVKPA